MKDRLFSFLKSFDKRRVLVTLGVVVLVVYFTSQYFFADELKVPDDFKRSREDSEVLSASIIDLAKQSAERLELVADKDQKRDFEAALDLLRQNLELNREAQVKATELAKNLEIMANNLNEISPVSARYLAINAVGAQVSLISHLIVYNDYLNRLLEILKSRFLGQAVASVQVSELVIKLSNEIAIINELNRQFNQTIRQFDGYFR